MMERGHVVTFVDRKRRARKLQEWLASQCPSGVRVTYRYIDPTTSNSGPEEAVYRYTIADPGGAREIDITEVAMEEFAPAILAAEIRIAGSRPEWRGRRLRIAAEFGQLLALPAAS